MNNVLVTGGCGFIGTNLAQRLIESGEHPLLLDNLSRPAAPLNLQWLTQEYSGRFTFLKGDVRDFSQLQKIVPQVTAVYHLAAQVAVTTSIEAPKEDFDVNALGTLHILESARLCATPPLVVFTSTNKVYGELNHCHVQELPTRYTLQHKDDGIDEEEPLSFRSPYGCSKGAADQYVRDYALTYNLPAVVLRMSCQYGRHQFGTEDQGWVAHFAISALRELPLTIYGDGKQTRDLLFVDDLVELFLILRDKGTQLKGEVFNVGGGPAHAISLLELVKLLEELTGKPLRLSFDAWRPGDQKVFISNITKACRMLDWRPKVAIRQGVTSLCEWLSENRDQLPSQ